MVVHSTLSSPAAILGVNILWATGGGATNLIADRLGGIVFAGEGGISG